MGGQTLVVSLLVKVVRCTGHRSLYFSRDSTSLEGGAPSPCGACQINCAAPWTAGSSAGCCRAALLEVGFWAASSCCPLLLDALGLAPRCARAAFLGQPGALFALPPIIPPCLLSSLPHRLWDRCRHRYCLNCSRPAAALPTPLPPPPPVPAGAAARAQHYAFPGPPPDALLTPSEQPGSMSEVKDERDAEIDALDALGALADFATCVCRLLGFRGRAAGLRAPGCRLASLADGKALILTASTDVFAGMRPRRSHQRRAAPTQAWQQQPPPWPAQRRPRPR